MNKRASKLTVIILIIVALGVIATFSFVVYRNQNAEFLRANNESQSKSLTHDDYEEPLPEGAVQTITIDKNGFPKETTVGINSIVAFTNNDTEEHTATADTAGTTALGAFDSGKLKPGEKKNVVQYGVAGTYTYHCSIHPSEKATIIVSE